MPEIAKVIAALRQAPVEEVPYQDVSGAGIGFPPYDEALWFKVRSDYSSVGPLEFLLRGGKLLQCGYVLAFPKRLFADPSKKAYERALQLALGHYEQGVAMPYPAGEGVLFNDSVTHCYVARCWAAPNKAVVLRVGDRAMWDDFDAEFGGQVA